MGEVLVGGEEGLDGEGRGDGRDVLQLDHVTHALIQTNLQHVSSFLVDSFEFRSFERLPVLFLVLLEVEFVIQINRFYFPLRS